MEIYKKINNASGIQKLPLKIISLFFIFYIKAKTLFYGKI